MMLWPHCCSFISLPLITGRILRKKSWKNSVKKYAQHTLFFGTSCFQFESFGCAIRFPHSPMLLHARSFPWCIYTIEEEIFYALVNALNVVDIRLKIVSAGHGLAVGSTGCWPSSFANNQWLALDILLQIVKLKHKILCSFSSRYLSKIWMNIGHQEI